MPTIILLDVSLSMCRTLISQGKEKDSTSDSIDPKQLANVGIGTLLDYLAQNAQLEYVSLIIFSSLWEIRHPFTRHHESIKNGIYDLELYDKSNIVNAIRGTLSLKLHEWLQNGPINIILITDGQLHHQSMRSNGNSRDTDSDQDDQEEEDVEMVNEGDEFHDISLSELEGQFDFPCKIQVVCLSSPREPALKYSIPFYKNLISTVDSSITDCPVISNLNTKHYKQSALWLPHSDSMNISIAAVEAVFLKLAELHYRPYHANLTCGHLSSMVMLSPKPTDCSLEPLKNEFDDLKFEQSHKKDSKETFVSAINKTRLYKLSDELNICGFMPLSDIASPSVISRHLVLPINNPNKMSEVFMAQRILTQNLYPTHNKLPLTIDESTNSTSDHLMFHCDTTAKAGTNTKLTSSKAQKTGEQLETDLTKQPSFCVLLHIGLKQENMVAICMIGKNEETGDEWFGMLHSHIDSKKRPSLMLSLLSPGSNPVLWLPNFKTLGSSMLCEDLPQAIRDKIASNRGPLKSYSSNSVIWLDPESVQADVQKIVRHAKRSPDKAPLFYRELNRIRRAAISYGFYDVLLGLAAILEREKCVMKLDSSKSVNQETLKHMDHVINCLRAGLTEESYDTNITPCV